MNPSTDEKLELLNKKVDSIYESVEKTRKYFFWTMIITVALIVIPLIGLTFAIPSFLSNYANPIQQTLGQ
jgi:type IV secretory pathway component VirB8